MERKRIRLPHGEYHGKRTYFVTMCTFERHPLFRDERLGKSVSCELRKVSERERLQVHAYCVMPDHIHLLAEGVSTSSNLMRFVSRFKQLTGFSFRKNGGGILWARSYFDYILRRDNEMQAIALYIWMNPLRKSLAGALRDYPLSGSFTVELPVHTPGNVAWTPPWKRMAP